MGEEPHDPKTDQSFDRCPRTPQKRLAKRPRDVRPPPPKDTRFKPGISGNPGGRPKLPPHLKKVREFTADEIRRIISMYGRMEREELQAVVKNPATPMFDLMVAGIYAQAAKSGDYARAAWLVDRLVGKLATGIDLATPGDNGIRLSYDPSTRLTRKPNASQGASAHGEDAAAG